MKAPLFIARRYLFARRGKSLINIISWISLVGLAVGTAALIVVLSVYNGFGEVTKSLYNVLDPALSIESAQGKSFTADEAFLQRLHAVKGIATVSPIVEENAWVTHKHNEAIVQLRGVDEHYGALTGLDTLVSEGAYMLHSAFPNEEGTLVDCLVLGGEIYYALGLSTYTNSPLSVHIPRRTGGLGLTMQEAFNIGLAYPVGCFHLQQDIDSRYILCSIQFARQLLDYADNEVTSLSLSVANPRHTARLKKELQALLGDDYVVKDRFDQQPLYYKVFRSERIGVFLILSLIVLISSLNLIASLSLLLIDKSKDIRILRAMGMEPRDVRRTFQTEGFLIALVGIGSGLIIGFLICLAQQQWGIVKMGANYIVEAFPVAMRWQDFVATTLVVSLLSLLSVLFTVRKAKL
ncbi:MAG: ABC transporter permease [Bacteroidales bacterium]|nr:ABC transporter permease [Bacteroidales bacterium]